MAHKGRLYKNWFRRDAAWSINWGPGMLPEAFECVFNTQIFSARYAVALFPTVLAINLNKTYTRIWTSPVVGGFFDNVYWTFELLSPPNEVVDKIKFGIWHNAIIPTPLYSATYRIQQPLLEWFTYSFSALEQLHFLSPDITVNPFPLRVTIQAARYARYNP